MEAIARGSLRGEQLTHAARASRLGVTIVLWRSDPRVLSWVAEGLRESRLRPAVLLVHVNESRETELTDCVRTTFAGAAEVVRVTSSAENKGFASAHNVLLAAAFNDDGCDAVIVLNPDVRLHPGAIGRLADFLPDAATMATPLLELADPETLLPEGRIDSAGIRWTRTARHLDALQGRPVDEAPARPTRVEGISGACLAVTRAAYNSMVAASGEFFDAAFHAYREDAELALRADALHIDRWLVPDAHALHVRRLRGTERGGSAYIDYLGVRNRFLIAFKHGRRRPGSPVLALARDLVVAGGVLMRERSSLPALRDAWRLRSSMRAKGRSFRAQARGRPHV